MRPRLFVLSIILSLGVGLAAHTVAERLRDGGGLEARASAQRAGDRWEYCAVTKAQFINSPRGGQYWINYFRGATVRTETVEAGVMENGLAKAIARLGEEGWEMVGEGTLDMGPGRANPSALYFKRPRE
jgi:hypothetical protein